MVVLQVHDPEVINLTFLIETSVINAARLKLDVIGVWGLRHCFDVDLGKSAIPLDDEVSLPKVVNGSRHKTSLRQEVLLEGSFPQSTRQR